MMEHLGESEREETRKVLNARATAGSSTTVVARFSSERHRWPGNE